MEAYERSEHAGVVVEIVHDDDPISPQDNDNAGTIYSWTRDFSGDEQISEPDRVIYVDATETDDGYREDVSLQKWFQSWYAIEPALVIPLRFDYHGSRGSMIYECEDDDANCALVFFHSEVEKEFDGHLDPYPVRSPDGKVRGYGGARRYAKSRIEELDNYLQGNVWGVAIRKRTGLSISDVYQDGENWHYRSTGSLVPSDIGVFDPEDDGNGEVLDSVWGLVGPPDHPWIRAEANRMAEDVAASLKEEAEEVAYWAARDVVTV